MTISIGATVSFITEVSGTTKTTTLFHTVNSSTTVLVVGLAIGSVGTFPVSCTFNGVNMTTLDFFDSSGVSLPPANSVAFFYTLSPHVGFGTIVVTLNDNSSFGVGAFNILNSNVNTPFGAFTESAATSINSVTSTAMQGSFFISILTCARLTNQPNPTGGAVTLIRDGAGSF